MPQLRFFALGLAALLLFGCGAPTLNDIDARTTGDAGQRDGASGDAPTAPDAADPIDPAFDHFFAEEIDEATQRELDDRVRSATLSTVHPRLFGENPVWLERVTPWETLDPDCTFTGEESGWGVQLNVRAVWDSYMHGGDRCGAGYPTRPEDHPDTAFYLAPPASEGNVSAHHTRQLRTIFLIRRELACHDAGGDCQFSRDDLERVITAFVTYEMARLRRLPRTTCGYVQEWHRSSLEYMDIEAGVGFRFFSLLIDTLDGHPALSDEDRGLVTSLLGAEIDSYLCSLEGPTSPACGDTLAPPCSRGGWSPTGIPGLLANCHWSLCNGNNWTPLLNLAALYWVITFHDEDDRASRVLDGILATNWLHRDQMLTDGTYTEGSSYFMLSYGPVHEMNALMRANFGEPLHSYRWGVLDRTGPWLLESMAPDGRAADFGDAWDARGFGHIAPIETALFRELVGMEPLGSTELDPCLVRRYYENVYYDGAFADPWLVEPALARDFAAIAARCTEVGDATLDIYPNQVEAISTVAFPGTTALGMSDRPLYEQADRVWLGLSGTPNEFPHRESDFGAIIWSAYGHRLLHDFGYGQIFHFRSDAYVYDGTNHVDYALGSNTLVIEEAAGAGSTYHAQFLHESGTMERQTFGAIEVASADGSAVYGRDDDAGWLDVMHRSMFRLDAGVHVVVDAFRTRGGRPLTVDSMFYTADSTTPGCTNAASDDVAVSVIDPTTIELTARCSDLERDGPGWAEGETRGRIVAASAGSATFQRGVPRFLADDAAFAPFLEGDVMVLETRTGSVVRREAFRFQPSAPQTSDVRVFLLVPGTITGTLPAAAVASATCTGATCFDVTVNGRTVRVSVDDAGMELTLEER